MLSRRLSNTMDTGFCMDALHESIAESRWALNAYFDYYNCERRHQSLDRKTPYGVYWGTKIDLKKIDYSGDKFKYIPFNPGDQKYQDITDQAK